MLSSGVGEAGAGRREGQLSFMPPPARAARNSHKVWRSIWNGMCKGAKMELSGMTGAYAQSMIQQSVDKQGQVLMRLMNVVTQVEVAHAKPLGGLSGANKVDITV